MAARTLPTAPSWVANQEITSSLLNQMCNYMTFWANPPSFRAEQHTSQNITTASFQQITCETVIHDSDSGLQNVSPYSYVIPFAGIWDFQGFVGVAVNAGGFRAPAIYVNGSSVVGGNPVYAPPTITGAAGVSVKGVPCNVGDVIGLYFDQNSGSTLATNATGSQSCWFAGQLVSLNSP